MTATNNIRKGSQVTLLRVLPHVVGTMGIMTMSLSLHWNPCICGCNSADLWGCRNEKPDTPDEKESETVHMSIKVNEQPEIL